MIQTWKPVFVGAFLLGAAVAAPTTTNAQSVADAQRAIEVEQYSAARTTLRKAITTSGSDMAYFALGQLYARMGKADSAAYYFEQGSVKFGNTITGKVSAGAALLQRGNLGGAEAKFEEVRKQTKNKDADALIRIAEAYVAAPAAVKDMSKPIQDLQLVTAPKGPRPNDPMAYVLLGDAFLRVGGKGGDAMTAYEKAIGANANDVRALYHKGLLNARSRNNNGARDDFQQVIKLDPTYAPAYAELADLYYGAGLYKEATQMITEYRNRAEKTPATEAKYAAFLFLSKDYANALTALNKAMATDSSNAIIRRLQAYALYETKNYKGAMQALERYRKVVPAAEQIGSDAVYYGKSLSKNNREDEALPMLTAALEKDSVDKDLQSEIAQIYVRKKQYPQAIKIYRARVAAGGANTDLYYLGDTYEKAGKFAAADSAYERITKSNPNFALAYYKRGLANNGLDPNSDKGLAKPHFEKFIAKVDSPGERDKYKPQLVTANKAIAVYYSRKGDKVGMAASKPYWEAALAIDPNDEQAKQTLNIINNPPKAAGVVKKPAGKK
ncbi:MAG: tetratricopeptide repeat protein [Hymenobacteraceae bacterium]|nr:tetratricopeptide repeat protein [Hymenobacteraceae bacterium]